MKNQLYYLVDLGDPWNIVMNAYIERKTCWSWLFLLLSVCIPTFFAGEASLVEKTLVESFLPHLFFKSIENLTLLCPSVDCTLALLPLCLKAISGKPLCSTNNLHRITKTSVDTFMLLTVYTLLSLQLDFVQGSEGTLWKKQTSNIGNQCLAISSKCSYMRMENEPWNITWPW